MTKGIEVLAKRLFSFTIIVFSMKLLVILFVRKKSICQGIFLVHPIYVTRSNFCGIVFKIDLLICNFLNFTAAFTKKLNFPKFAFNFPCEKVNFSLIHRTHITIHSFLRSLLSSQVLSVVSKSYIQTNSKTSDYCPGF